MLTYADVCWRMLAYAGVCYMLDMSLNIPEIPPAERCRASLYKHVLLKHIPEIPLEPSVFSVKKNKTESS
jgi:hypothetical protein